MHVRGVISSLVILCASIPALAQPAARPADAAAIDRAIESGVSYLKSVQTPAGGWGAGTGPGGDKGWLIGYSSLAGLALVECGVPTSDPALKRAAQGVRGSVNDLDNTYEVALAILFLDRMGNKSDRVHIQTLAARLIAGQTSTGGWGYKVPKLTLVERDQVLGALRKINPPLPAPLPSVRERPTSLGLCIKSSDDTMSKPPPAATLTPEKVREAAMSTLTAAMKRWPVFLLPAQIVLADSAGRNSEPFNATTDNSNTHFATIALWAARRHDVPCDRSLALLAQRFRTSQGGDGTWGYAYAKNGGGGSRPLTCVALLGLAIGHVIDPDPNVKPEQDPKVLNAFVWLSKQIGEPAGTTLNRPTPKDVGGLYYMWAMERIAVLYDVGKLDKKDWHKWGAEILLCHQSPEGFWAEGGFPGEHAVLNTALAMLFLKRANLTPDLSRRLVLDQAALTTKVDDTVKPPAPKPPEPTPTVEPTPPKVEPKVEPKIEPKIEPTPPVPMMEPVTPPSTTTPTPEKKGAIWPWLLLLVLLLVILAVCTYLVMKRRNAAVEEERPRKKKKKPAG